MDCQNRKCEVIRLNAIELTPKILNFCGQSAGISSITPEILNDCSCFRNLEDLDFSECDMGDREIEALIPFIQRLGDLKRINLSENDLSEEGLLSLLFTIVTKTRYLEHINLENNENIGGNGSKYISDILYYSTHLKSINLGGINLSANLLFLTEGLKQAASLKNLIIEGCNLYSAHMKVIIAALMEDDCYCRLKSVALGYNQLTKGEAAMIFRPLVYHAYFKSLKELYLSAVGTLDILRFCRQKLNEGASQSGIPHEVVNYDRVPSFSHASDPSLRTQPSFAQVMAIGLTKNTTLRKVVLDGNSFVDMDCQFFKQALAINSSLVSFDLSQNQISSTGGKLLLSTLLHKETRTLKNLNLSYNDFDITPQFQTLVEELKQKDIDVQV